MNPSLKRNDDELRRLFLSLKSLDDVAELLEIDGKTLIFYLYRNKDKNYRSFNLKKKSGGERAIFAPISPLKIIQRKLADILYLFDQPRKSAHGFVKERSIISNARPHINARFVANIDLKDFFPSINFGRVRGIFSSNPFLLPDGVSTILAQICCLNGTLPQGAPTSPVISNFICRRLDGQLLSLASRHRLTVTRYADDITFSKRGTKFPAEVISYDEETRLVAVGGKLLSIVRANGFEINDKKVRSASSVGRQEVTGLIVNKKMNVRRAYIRNLRAVLHNWKKDGLKKTQANFYRLAPRVNRLKANSANLQTVMEGRINFIRMVRGQKDKMYRSLKNQLDDLIGRAGPRLPLSSIDEINKCLWVIKCGRQTGTGFMVDGLGLVTAHHIIRSGHKIEVFTWDNIGTKFEATVIADGDDVHDVAILGVANLDYKKFLALRRGDDSKISYGTAVSVAGFPNYREAERDEPVTGDTKVFGKLRVSELVLVGSTRRLLVGFRYRIGPVVSSGMSGGPVVDGANQVLGIIASGFKAGSVHGTHEMEFAFVPIGDVDALAAKVKSQLIAALRTVEKSKSSRL